MNENPFSPENRPFFTDRWDMIKIVEQHSMNETLDAIDAHHERYDNLERYWEEHVPEQHKPRKPSWIKSVWMAIRRRLGL